MKTLQEHAKPNLATLMNRSDWGIVMIPGHYLSEGDEGLNNVR